MPAGFTAGWAVNGLDLAKTPGARVRPRGGGAGQELALSASARQCVNDPWSFFFLPLVVNYT